MATLELNPPARLGAHLLAQQRIPHAARASAVEGVADLSPVFEQSALSAASGWAADGLHIEDGIDHAAGAALMKASVHLASRSTPDTAHQTSIMSFGYLAEA